jgi:hypothetical protein
MRDMEVMEGFQIIGNEFSPTYIEEHANIGKQLAM